MSATPRPVPAKILLIGGTGQVGWELQRTLAPLGEVVTASICGAYGPVVDLVNPDSVRTLIRDQRPDIIVNAAAYTAVDKAESDRDTAFLVNAKALEDIGQQANNNGALVIHYSTDFVFDGRASEPYQEDDPTGPLNVYGETKLAGEQALLDSGAGALIFRTSWVYGMRGNNFLLTLLRLFRERSEVRVVNDQIGAPTWCRMLAEATAQVIAQLPADPDARRTLTGVYHLTNQGQTSWHGFAAAILAESGLDCTLTPIPTEHYPTPARRPAFSVLDNSKLMATFKLRLPDWQVALRQCLEERQSLG